MRGGGKGADVEDEDEVCALDFKCVLRDLCNRMYKLKKDFHKARKFARSDLEPATEQHGISCDKLLVP